MGNIIDLHKTKRVQPDLKHEFHIDLERPLNLGLEPAQGNNDIRGSGGNLVM